MRSGGWLFSSLDPADPLTPRWHNRTIPAATDAAGIDKGISTHKLRHGFATTCWNARSTGNVVSRSNRRQQSEQSIALPEAPAPKLETTRPKTSNAIQPNTVTRLSPRKEAKKKALSDFSLSACFHYLILVGPE
jgi:hypothetical protein